MKTLLIDADGVLLKKQPYFSLRISEEYKVPYELMTPFYTGELKTCQIGKADMKEELAKYLPRWNWDKSTDDFLSYWFITDVIPDEAVLLTVDALRAKGIKCYVASEQEKYRSEYIWNNAGLKDRMDGSFFTHDVGALKSTPGYFREILATLGKQPEEVMFWDDDQKNVDVAKSVGIDAHFYSDFEGFKAVVSAL